MVTHNWLCIFFLKYIFCGAVNGISAKHLHDPLLILVHYLDSASTNQYTTKLMILISHQIQDTGEREEVTLLEYVTILDTPCYPMYSLIIPQIL